MFPVLEPVASASATNVTAAWTSGSVLEATCQQTYSALFRGVSPPLGLKISILCPQSTLRLGQFILKIRELSLFNSFSTITDCDDRSAFSASRVTGCAAQNLYAPEHSDVCLTAIHAGLMTSAGGEFAIQAVAAGIEYQGCVGNGADCNI